MRYVICAIYAFIGVLLYSVPNLTPRDFLFSVRVPSGFRGTDEARRAIAAYRARSGGTTLIAICALVLEPERWLNVVAVAAPAAIILVSVAAFHAQYRSLARFRVRSAVPGTALTTGAGPAPRFAWLAVGPFSMLALAAAFLHAHWSAIPERFPVHFDAAGRPNRWAERTVHGVYGPLFFGGELCLWFAALGLAAWFGSRRSHFQRTALGAMIAIEYMLAALFAMISVQSLLRIPVWLIVLFPLAVVISLVAVIVRRAGEPSAADQTPDECWRAGVFYYNAGDPAVVVEKRDGLGYTFNFANRWAWALLIALVLVLVSAPFVLA